MRTAENVLRVPMLMEKRKKPRPRQSGPVTRTQSKDGAEGPRVGTRPADSALLVTQG